MVDPPLQLTFNWKHFLRKDWPLDTTFWSFLTFSHGIERVGKPFLAYFVQMNKTVQRKRWSTAAVSPKLLACIGFQYKVVQFWSKNLWIASDNVFHGHREQIKSAEFEKVRGVTDFKFSRRDVHSNFLKSFQTNQKIKELWPKMTKIVSKGVVPYTQTRFSMTERENHNFSMKENAFFA